MVTPQPYGEVPEKRVCEGGVAPFAHPFFGLIRSMAEQLHLMYVGLWNLAVKVATNNSIKSRLYHEIPVIAHINWLQPTPRFQRYVIDSRMAAR